VVKKSYGPGLVLAIILTSSTHCFVENDDAVLRMDASTIAMVCWKGKSNLSIMVSPSDAKELLERLEIRHGKIDVTTSIEVLEESLLENDAVAPPDDAEAVKGTENMEVEAAI
jgi:multisite-specific tRNA:(cytosine-C5)-methyltransferase